MYPDLDCPKCEELNKDAIFFDDWDLCPDCAKGIKEFINLENNPMRYKHSEAPNEG